MKTREPWHDFLREFDQWSSKLGNPKNALPPFHGKNGWIRGPNSFLCWENPAGFKGRILFLDRIFVGYEKKPFGYMSNDKWIPICTIWRPKKCLRFFHEKEEVFKNEYFHSITHIFFQRKKANFNEASKPRAKRIAHKIEISWTIFLPKLL